MSVSKLYIHGTEMPAPALQGVTITKEPIWSAATGRTTSGKMVGEIIGYKHTLKIKWGVLTQAQAATVLGAIGRDDFFTVAFVDAGGTQRSLTMYASAVSFTQYCWADGHKLVLDGTVDLIEQ